MTLDEFLAEVAKIDGWELQAGGIIRLEEVDTHCPITAVYSRRSDESIHVYFADEVDEAARCMNLSDFDTTAIVDAADKRRDNDHYVRAKLLAACKLTEIP